jgi:hypothetical protein
MRTKALVVNPWVTDFKLYDEWMHPCGLYFLMTLLSQNGVEVFYWNCLKRSGLEKSKSNGTGDFPSMEHPKPALYRNIRRRYKLYGVPAADFHDYLKAIPRPDIICVGSAMTYWVEGLKITVDIIAKVFPGVPLIIGGSSATLMPAVLHSLMPSVHIFGGSLFDQPRLARSGIPVLSTLSALPPDSSMLPAFELLDDIRHLPVITSFGCPLSCSYCASRMLEGEFRPRPPAVVADEVESIVSRFGVKNAAFYDDALLFEPAGHFLPFCRMLSDRNVVLNFHTPNGMHVKYVTPEILDTMRNTGFTTLRFGFESGSSGHRHHTDGKTSIEQLAHNVGLMRHAGFTGEKIGVYIMGGLPGQAPGDMMRDVDAVASLGIKVKPVFLSPVPKTKLFDFYADLYPEITTDPLTHNDSYFITRLPGWDGGAVQEVFDGAKRHNGRFAAG